MPDLACPTVLRKARSAWLPGLALLGLVSTGCGEAPLTWEQFERSVYREPESGVYVVSGDEIIEGEAALRVFHEKIARAPGPGDTASVQRPLSVNQLEDGDDRWGAAEAEDLTYCVAKAGFGARYVAVVRALRSAAGAWEGAARVHFLHDDSRDETCTRRSATVFNVRAVCGAPYLARAFFPSSARPSRELLIDCSALENIAPLSLTGVLRHELGHVLGFRHEHTRPEAGACFEDDGWRALTSYDAASVMHYPQCNGRNTGDLLLTARDRAGAAALYP